MLFRSFAKDSIDQRTPNTNLKALSLLTPGFAWYDWALYGSVVGIGLLVTMLVWLRFWKCARNCGGGPKGQSTGCCSRPKCCCSPSLQEPDTDEDDGLEVYYHEQEVNMPSRRNSVTFEKTVDERPCCGQLKTPPLAWRGEKVKCVSLTQPRYSAAPTKSRSRSRSRSGSRTRAQ